MADILLAQDKYGYRSGDAIICKSCGRARVMADGVCEKCEWDNDGGDYARVTRPNEYDSYGKISDFPDNPSHFSGGK